MFGPLEQESLSFGFTMALVTGPVVTRAPRLKIFNLLKISLVTLRRMNDGDQDGTL